MKITKRKLKKLIREADDWYGEEERYGEPEGAINDRIQDAFVNGIWVALDDGLSHKEIHQAFLDAVEYVKEARTPVDGDEGERYRDLGPDEHDFMS